MFADEDLEARAQMPRLQQQAEQHHGPEEEGDLGDAAPVAAVGFDVVAGRRHDQQIDPGTQKGGGVEDHVAGDEHVQGPLGIARCGNRQQRHHHGKDHAPGAPDGAVELLEQQPVGVHVKVVDEQPADADTQELDGPALIQGRVAVDLLHQHQPRHRQQHVAEDRDVGGQGGHRQDVGAVAIGEDDAGEARAQREDDDGQQPHAPVAAPGLLAGES